MLERYFVRSATIDRIRASWIAGAIERYVEWLTGHRYAPRNVLRRVSLLERFGDFTRALGVTAWDQLPTHVDAFVEVWVRERGQGCRTERARRKVADVARTPIEQMLRLVVPGFVGRGRVRGPAEPFAGHAGSSSTTCGSSADCATRASRSTDTISPSSRPTSARSGS